MKEMVLIPIYFKVKRRVVLTLLIKLSLFKKPPSKENDEWSVATDAS